MDETPTNENNAVPVEANSLSDYTPYKLNFLLPLPISKETKSNYKQAFSIDKPKTSSKKRTFIRYILPTYHSRLSLPSISYDQQTTNSPINDICDMRFIIIRHGERVDRYFGANWYKLAFDENDQYRPYHRNYPSSLPFRSNRYFWALDTPLTSTGLDAAERLGRSLWKKNVHPQYVYSSPAMRCILTTIQILKGLKLDNQVAIRIEPGLLEFGASKFGMHIFLQPMDWHQYGVNVDLSYQPILSIVPPYERENAYYLRSKYVIREIEKRHQNTTNQVSNIFLIAHATSPETLTWDLLGRQPNVDDLYRLSLNVAYLQTVIIEHKQDKPYWSFQPRD